MIQKTKIMNFVIIRIANILFLNQKNHPEKTNRDHLSHPKSEIFMKAYIFLSSVWFVTRLGLFFFKKWSGHQRFHKDKKLFCMEEVDALNDY